MSLRANIVDLHRKITDPEQKGPILCLMRFILLFPSAVYAFVAILRNKAYDHGWLTSHSSEAPVISIGNLTAGGTGKTPFVVWLVDELKKKGHFPAVLSRGYGRDSQTGVDDENEMLSRHLEDVPAVVNPDRVEAAGDAVQQHGADVLVLDDGFQHRRLKRDLDVVLIDAMQPFGAGHMLPRGTLREPLSGLVRADLVVVTRADQVGEEELEKIREKIRRTASEIPVALARHAPCGVKTLSSKPKVDHEFDLSDLADGRWLAFCALGNPLAFRRTLEQESVDVASFEIFPDHHRYNMCEVHSLEEKAVREECRGLITTEKDAVKIRRLLQNDLKVPILEFQVRMEIFEGKELLEKAVRI
ncbi:MAG: tetraacyldisaccharide 4'-kinase [Planctomycetes bacterium]|nr:tetraacyldisaccharide 4'-kinase [Planctomycetota bacterium]